MKSSTIDVRCSVAKWHHSGALRSSSRSSAAASALSCRAAAMKQRRSISRTAALAHSECGVESMARTVVFLTGDEMARNGNSRCVELP